jgi:hypothetical protein
MMKHLLSATLILLSTLSYAQVPNSFSSGETISSSQINANFSFLADAMGRGNVKAMMLCKDRWIGDLQNTEIGNQDEFISPNIVFSNCLAPDNTTLTSINGCYIHESLGSNFCYSGGARARAIFSKNLIVNGWILSFIEKVGSSGDTNIYYYFYKISDQ